MCRPLIPQEGPQLRVTDSSGQTVITIRTNKVDTLSEFIVKPQATNPQLTKDFIYGLDQLLVERTVTSTTPKKSTKGFSSVLWTPPMRRECPRGER
ncbi:MAG: hypothetical protein U0V87_18010 [Acidobacteriota bacterium]